MVAIHQIYDVPLVEVRHWLLAFTVDDERELRLLFIAESNVVDDFNGSAKYMRD